MTAWFEGCAVHSSSSPASSSRCTRRFNNVQLTVRATGVWVPEEAVVLLEVFDAGGLLRAEHEVNEQQLGLQLGGGFDPGAYRVVVSLLPLQQDGETGRGRPLAAVAISLILQ